ncbi:hypothetical protein HanPI659440_Chr09g0339051 [Helianthus annuus]|nr:hypothetical protein HanPI659440_Chr09g0339051 [Helianthus annuus]
MKLGVFKESVLMFSGGISGGIFGISGDVDGARLVGRRWWGVVQRRKMVVGRSLVGVFATAAVVSGHHRLKTNHHGCSISSVF